MARRPDIYGRCLNLIRNLRGDGAIKAMALNGTDFCPPWLVGWLVELASRMAVWPDCLHIRATTPSLHRKACDPTGPTLGKSYSIAHQKKGVLATQPLEIDDVQWIIVIRIGCISDLQICCAFCMCAQGVLPTYSIDNPQSKGSARQEPGDLPFSTCVAMNTFGTGWFELWTCDMCDALLRGISGSCWSLPGYHRYVHMCVYVCVYIYIYAHIHDSCKLKKALWSTRVPHPIWE